MLKEPIKQGYKPSFRQNKEYESNLAKIRVEEGYTVKGLAELAGCYPAAISGLQNGMVSPYYTIGRHKGHVKPCVEAISSILNASLSQLFPRYICDINRFRGVEVPFVKCQMPGFLLGQWICNQSTGNGKSEIIDFEIKGIVSRALATLTSREEMVMRRRFGIGTSQSSLGEIAESIGATKERIRQIEAKALRKLRHPGKHLNLSDFLENFN